jgi:hypothetical protein
MLKGIRILRLPWVPAFLLLLVSGCVPEEEIKSLILAKWPTFETDVRAAIETKYSQSLPRRYECEWRITEAPKKSEWNVVYGCFRKVTLGEDLGAGFVEELSSGVSGGLISYNPRSDKIGAYVTLLVNTRDSTFSVVR